MYYSINDIVRSIGDEKFKFLPFFHAHIFSIIVRPGSENIGSRMTMKVS